MTDEEVKTFIHKLFQGNLKENGLTIRNEKLPHINLPLYKYCSVNEIAKKNKETREYNIENFENDVLYFQDPAQFNDPFDCYLGFSQSQIVKDLLIQKLKSTHQYTQRNKNLINNLFNPYVLDLSDDEVCDTTIKVIESCINEIDAIGEIEKFSINFIIDIANYDKELFLRIIQNRMTILDKQRLIDMLLDNPQYQDVFKNNIKSDNGDTLLKIVRHDMKLKIETNPNELTFENNEDIFAGITYIWDILSDKHIISLPSNELDTIKSQLDDLSNKALYQARKMVSEQFKVTCLSERMDSSLMWSHYANKHLGFCLEYDFTANMSNIHNDLLLAQLMLFPVKYTNDRPLLSKALFNPKNTLAYLKSKKFPSDAIEKIMFGLLTKSEDWSYEKEWRIFQLGKSEMMKLPKPRKIFLGAKMEEETKEKLVVIARKKNIPIFQMQLKPDKYEFSYYQVT